MLLSIYFCIVIALSIAYIFFLYRIFSFWDDIPEVKINKAKVTALVSVIVAARNEASNILDCINSILQNQTSIDFELVLVNDHSEDNTLEIVKSISDKRLKVLSLPSAKHGKKAALDFAIKRAQGDLILCTDADSTVGINWISAMVSQLEQNKMVTGPLRSNTTLSSLGAFQILDLSGMMAITAYGLGTDTFYLANGANLGFSKEAFLKIKGYQGNENYASGDDVFLIQKMAKSFPGKVAFVKSKNAIVETKGVNTSKDFFAQRKRWATKSGGYSDLGLQVVLAFIFIFNLILVLNLVVGPFLGGALFFVGLIQLFIKMTMDYLLLSNLSKYFESEKAMKLFFQASFWAIVNILYSGFIGLFAKNYTWKGRPQQ